MTPYDWDESGRRARLLVPLLYVDAAVTVTAILLVLTDGPTPFFGSRRIDPFGGLLLVGLVLWLATALLWLRWFHVVAERAEATGRTRFRGLWWFWAWVIPGANLVLPKMMVNDAWHAADVRRPDPMPPVIGWWWAAWVMTGALNYVSKRFDVPTEGTAMAVFLGVFYLGEAGQAILGADLVRRLTERDRLLGSNPAWLEPAPAESRVP